MHAAITRTTRIRTSLATLVLLGSIALFPTPSQGQSSSDTADVLVIAVRGVVDRVAPHGKAALSSWPTQNFSGAMTPMGEGLRSVGRRTGLPVPSSEEAFECDPVGRYRCRPRFQQTLLMLGIPNVGSTAAEVEVEVAYPSEYKQLLVVELRRASPGGWAVERIRVIGTT